MVDSLVFMTAGFPHSSQRRFHRFRSVVPWLKTKGLHCVFNYFLMLFIDLCFLNLLECLQPNLIFLSSQRCLTYCFLSKKEKISSEHFQEPGIKEKYQLGMKLRIKPQHLEIGRQMTELASLW